MGYIICYYNTLCKYAPSKIYWHFVGREVVRPPNRPPASGSFKCHIDFWFSLVLVSNSNNFSLKLTSFDHYRQFLARFQLFFRFSVFGHLSKYPKVESYFHHWASDSPCKYTLSFSFKPRSIDSESKVKQNFQIEFYGDVAKP